VAKQPQKSNTLKYVAIGVASAGLTLSIGLLCQIAAPCMLMARSAGGVRYGAAYGAPSDAPDSPW